MDDSLPTQIAVPQIVGLLLGKAAEASERGIDLMIGPETWLSDSRLRVQALTTIIGNLVEEVVTVTVSDNGPGVSAELARLIFHDGTPRSRPPMACAVVWAWRW